VNTPTNAWHFPNRWLIRHGGRNWSPWQRNGANLPNGNVRLPVRRNRRQEMHCVLRVSAAPRAAVLNDWLRAKTWLVGEPLTHADFSLGAIVPSAERMELPVGKFPEIIRCGSAKVPQKTQMRYASLCAAHRPVRERGTIDADRQADFACWRVSLGAAKHGHGAALADTDGSASVFGHHGSRRVSGRRCALNTGTDCA